MNNRNNMNNTTNSNYGYGSDASLQPMREEVSFAVPASKCGVSVFLFQVWSNIHTSAQNNSFQSISRVNTLNCYINGIPSYSMFSNLKTSFIRLRS